MVAGVKIPSISGRVLMIIDLKTLFFIYNKMAADKNYKINLVLSLEHIFGHRNLPLTFNFRKKTHFLTPACGPYP